MSSAWGGEHGVEGIDWPRDLAQQQKQMRHTVQHSAGDHVITTAQPVPDQRQHQQQQSQHQRLQRLLALHQQGRLPPADAGLLQLLLHQQAAQQGRLTTAGVQQLQALEQQEAAEQQAQQQRAQQQAQQQQVQQQLQHQQQAQQQAQMRTRQQQRRGMPAASAAAPAATSAVTAAGTSQGGAQRLNDSMGVMESLVSQLANANPAPKDLAIVKPRQLLQRMEQLRRRRAEAVEHTMRRQTQLEREFFAHKLAIQDALQKELAELEDESRKAEAQLEWHAKNGAIALMATGGAAVASAVVEAASAAPPALAAPSGDAAVAQPEPAHTLAIHAAGDALPADQLVSPPVYAPHLAAVGSAHLASATPPPSAAANLHTAATPAASSPASVGLAAASDTMGAANAAVAAAAGAAPVGSPLRPAAQAPPSEPPAVQSPGLPPRPPPMARRQRSGPVARSDDSLTVRPVAPPQFTTKAAEHADATIAPIMHQQPQQQPTEPPDAAVLAAGRGLQQRRQAAAGPAADGHHAAAGLGALESRSKRMDLLASAAVSQPFSTPQQPPRPSQPTAMSSAGAAAALLSLHPGPGAKGAAADEQPSAAHGPAAAHLPASPTGAGASDVRVAGSYAAAGPAAEAQDRTARSLLPATGAPAAPAAAGSPAEERSDPMVVDLDADSGATAPSADQSGSWRVGDEDAMAVDLEDASNPAGEARSGDHSGQGSGSRKRKAAGSDAVGTPQHAETLLAENQPSGGCGAHQPEPPAAESRQPTAAQWTAVATTWHLLPGRDKPTRVKDVNTVAREADDQDLAASIKRRADARQQLAVQPDMPPVTAGAVGGGQAVQPSQQDGCAATPEAPASQLVHGSTAGLPRTAKGRPASRRSPAVGVPSMPSRSPSASGGSTAPDAPANILAEGSRKRRRPRGSPLAAGAQSGNEAGIAPRKSRRLGVKRLSELARTAAAAEPRCSEQPASGLQLQNDTRQSSHGQSPENAAAQVSKPQGTAADASPGLDASSPHVRRAAAAQAAAVTQAMLQPLKPAAKPAAKPGAKPGHVGTASKRSPSVKPTADGAAAQLATPATAAEAPDAVQGAAAPAAGGAAGTDPAATDSKPGDSFYVFRLPRVRPRAGGRCFPAVIFTAAGLEPLQGTAPMPASEAPGDDAAAIAAKAAAAGSVQPGGRPLQQMHTNLPDLKWHLNRQAIISRAWNDKDNVSRLIPKSWSEALAHPTLRSLTLRSSRRYSVRSIVGLRGGAGPAWLLHTLLAEFGVDRKVAGVRRAAPRRQWLPAWRAARPQQHPPLQASEQPPQQPELQPPQQQQQPAQGAAAPPDGSQQRPSEQERSKQSPDNCEASFVQQDDEDAPAPHQPDADDAAPAEAAAAVPADVSAGISHPAPDAPAAATADGERAAAQPDLAGAAAEHGVQPPQQAPVPKAMTASADTAAADGFAAPDRHLLPLPKLSNASRPALPDAAAASQPLVASSSAQAEDDIADVPSVTPSEEQQQQQQLQQQGADAAPEHAAVADVHQDAIATEAEHEQQLPEAAGELLLPLTAAEPSSPDANSVIDDSAVAVATAATLAAVVDAVAEAAQPAHPGAGSTAVAVATAAALAAVVDAVAEAVQPPHTAAVSTCDDAGGQPGLPPAEAAAGQQLDSGQPAQAPAEPTQQANSVAAEPAASLQPSETAAEPVAELSVLAAVQADVAAGSNSNGTAGPLEHLQDHVAAGVHPQVPPLDAVVETAATPATGKGDAPVAVQSKEVAVVHPSKALIPWPQQQY